MPLIGFSIELIFFVFSGFVFHVSCHDLRKECFDVESETICYLMPNVSSVDWDTAWKTCREMDTTLPVILNEKGQKALENYISNRSLVQPVWTAGRYVGSNDEWRWLNGQNFSGTEKPSCPRNEHTCVHETQAVLTKQLRYDARYPNNTYDFICSFPGISCTTESNNSLTWKDGCLIWKNKHGLRLNKARNECIEGGGDLATFSDKGDHDRLQQVSTLKEGDDYGYWIGLHRKWWIWNTTGVHDIKYNLLDDYGDQGKDCLFINESSKWNRDICSMKKTVICQTETRKPSSDNEPLTTYVAIGIVIALLVAAITVVILLIFIRKRWRVAGTKPDAGTSTTKSDPVTPSLKAIVEYQDDTYATIEDDDLDNLSGENGSNPSTSYTNGEFRYKSVSVYSEPADFNASEANKSTDVYSEPYSSSAVMTPLPKNSVDQPSYINAAVIKSQKQKKSNDLATPPIKIGPKGDVYTLPISHN